MTTRKQNVLEAAVRQSNLLIEALEAKQDERTAKTGSKKRSDTNRLIRDACNRMLARRSPTYPSAQAISEECGLLSRKPPAPRTINNRYSEMHRIWRNAFEVLLTEAAVPGVDQVDDYNSYDRSHMSNDDRRFTEDLLRRNQSLRHKNNILRQFVAENVPLQSGEALDDGDLLDEVASFLETVLEVGFELDDVALRTTRRVPSGAIVMERTLFDRLQAMVDSRARAYQAASLLG